MKAATKSVLMAMAYTETIREVVDKYHAEILSIVKPKRKDGTLITKWSSLYLASDIDAEDCFLFAGDEAKKAGLKVNKEGNCPLLEAENVQRIAERNLCDIMEEVTGLSADDLICSVSGMDNYRKYIDLTLKLIAPKIKMAA